MSRRDQMPMEPAFALITEAPTDPAPARSHVYYGDVQTPDGRLEHVRIGPNVSTVWPLPLYVRPMEAGMVIPGCRVGEREFQWYGQEIADFGICSQAAGRSSVSGAMSILMSLTRDELLWLKKQLEAL